MSRPQDLLLSIVYSSNAISPFDDAALLDLLSHSRDNNRRDGLTGMLLYRNGRFLQVLEGPEPAVRERMSVIAADGRHGEVRVLLEESIEDRQFPEWSMGYESDSDAVGADVPGYRDAFADLDEPNASSPEDPQAEDAQAEDAQAEDASRLVGAVRELTRWFQPRAVRAD